MRKRKLSKPTEVIPFPVRPPQGSTAPAKWTCYRCEDDKVITEKRGFLSVKGQGFEGEIPLCHTCIRTIVQCLSRRTRLTPIYSPPVVKRYCAQCRFQVFGSGTLCITCKAKNDADEGAA